MPIDTFDFGSFLRQLSHGPTEGMLMCARMRMAVISDLCSRDVQIGEEGANYVRKLSQLVDFLQTCQIPPKATSEERAIYNSLARRLFQNAYLARGTSQGSAISA